jgi:hypothetical protein
MHTSHRGTWRLVGDSRLLGEDARGALAEGLRLHLQHTPMDTVLMRIGARQQSYVALNGCAGCAWERCEPGCRVELLRRLLAERAPMLRLEPVRGELAPRPYARVALAIPTRGRTLNGAMLQNWPEARLVVRWRPGHKGKLTAAALLLAGAEGHDPRAALRAQGWRAWCLPVPLARRWSWLLPSLLPLRAQQPTPFLLLPSEEENSEDAAGHVLADDPEQLTCSEASQSNLMSAPPMGLDQQLTIWLRALLASPQQPVEEPTPLEERIPSPWPDGPGGLKPPSLGQLIERLIAEPSFQSTRKGQSGITKGRLAGLRYPGLSENVARTLMVWLDRAGVLAPAEDGQGPWRAPRPFALTDPEQIAAKLRDTPLPTAEEVRAAYGGEA